MDFFIEYFSFIGSYIFLLKCFIVGFFLNLLWEVIHSQLYETCCQTQLNQYIPKIINASIKDWFFIMIFTIVSVITFQNVNILSNIYQWVFFAILCLIFSYFDEKISLRYKRWEYTKAMPMIFGVGISPLVEIVITWFFTIFIVSLI